MRLGACVPCYNIYENEEIARAYPALVDSARIIGQVINLGTNIYLKRQGFPPEHFWAVPWWLVVFAIVFAFLVSLISGLYPAARAARLDPVQALRYE